MLRLRSDSLLPGLREFDLRGDRSPLSSDDFPRPFFSAKGLTLLDLLLLGDGVRSPLSLEELRVALPFLGEGLREESRLLFLTGLRLSSEGDSDLLWLLAFLGDGLLLEVFSGEPFGERFSRLGERLRLLDRRFFSGVLLRLLERLESRRPRDRRLLGDPLRLRERLRAFLGLLLRRRSRLRDRLRLRRLRSRERERERYRYTSLP